MSEEITDKVCEECGVEFATTRADKKYCSYTCYMKAAKKKSSEYHKKLRTAGKIEETRLCKNCEEPFTTSSKKKVYCKYECYREACLEKNREYMAAIRDKWKQENPPPPREHECMMCETMISTKRKYCDKCRTIASSVLRVNKKIETTGG